MSLPNMQVVMVVMHLINIIMPMMRRHWWRGRAKTEQSESQKVRVGESVWAGLWWVIVPMMWRNLTSYGNQL